MSAYSDFKRCLIDGWPNAPVRHCAQMVMRDYGLKCEVESLLPDNNRIMNFVQSLKMPFIDSLLHNVVSVYLAACYPNTSAALFDGAGKNAAFSIFIKEKKRAPKRKRSLVSEFKPSEKKDKAIVFIRARQLDKKHDWHTVK